MCDTAGSISIASAYGCEIYANVLEKLTSKIISYEDIIFLVISMYKICPFDSVGILMRLVDRI